ncbi:hypothetical protein [Fervidicoccus sp.]|uniref:hypothetical protein n=1 Tax=Fervidicoccus sp. TaxID=2060324 RepID=UPI003D0DBF85
MSEEENKEASEQKVEKKDIKSLVAIIPPAGALKSTQKKISEKRIRVRYSSTKPEHITINPKLASELGIKDKAYIVIAGKKRFLFNVILDENVPENEVYANNEFMKENGVSDNSIATIRSL